ncbi:MAG: hypothetical protein JST59_00040, partial [Actinobacteria bacterium]|nr:hypothetical protein [Actinomycetota bacterium]
KLTENDAAYGQRINKLSSENKMLSDDLREGQEKLRISASQTSKLMNEFNEVKARIDQLTRENDAYKNRGQDFQSRLTELSAEIERLNTLL